MLTEVSYMALMVCILSPSYIYLTDNSVEEIDFPFVLVGNGKEIEKPSLRLGLKWPGRVSLVVDRGLPSKPPGKMFRSDVLGLIPLSKPNNAGIVGIGT